VIAAAAAEPVARSMAEPEVAGMVVAGALLRSLAPQVSRGMLRIGRSRMARPKCPRRRPAVLQLERG
jgi:hypothetical protein